MWKKVDIKTWPWNLAYMIHRFVYYDSEQAEAFANRLYFPGMVQVLEERLDPDEAQALVNRFRSNQFLRDDLYRMYMRRLASIANIQKMDGVCRYIHPDAHTEHPVETKEILLKDLPDTDLPTRVIHMLSSSRFYLPSNPYIPDHKEYQFGTTVRDLIQYARSDLLKLRHIGSATVDQIDTWLSSNALRLNPHRQFTYCHPDSVYRYRVVLSPNCTLNLKEMEMKGETYDS